MFNLYATASFSWKYMYTMKIKQAKAVNFQSKLIAFSYGYRVSNLRMLTVCHN